MGKNYNGTQANHTATIVATAAAEIADVRNRVVKFDENGEIVLATAGTDLPAGVAIIEAGYNDVSGEESGKVAKGDDVDIAIKDIIPGVAGGTIAVGDLVAAGAAGAAVKAETGNYVLGVAMDAGAEGELVNVQISKFKI